MFPIVLSAVLFSCSPSEKADPPHTYQMGERVPVGHITYTVFERQWQTQLGAGLEARVPQNRFFLLRVSANNDGGAEAIVPNLELVDDSNSAYAELGDGEGVADWLGSKRQVSPSKSTQGYVLFDVQPRHYKLKFIDEDGKSAAFVDIPLTLDSDAPDVTTPLPADPLAAPAKR